MEKSTYKLKMQKLKGTWSMYILFLGAALCFVNFYAGLATVAVAVLLTSYFKKNKENQSAMYFNYAMKCFSSGDTKNAKTALNNAINLNNLNSEAYFFLGCIYFDECDYTQALDFLKRGGVDDVKDPSLVYVLGRCYYHIENFDTAVKYLEMIEYQEGSEMEQQRLFTLGRAYSELEEYDKSLTALKKADIEMEEELEGESLEYCYFLGVAYYHLDKIKEAKEYVQRVFNKDRAYKYIDLYAKNLEIN